MKSIKLLILVAGIIIAGFLSGCSSDKSDTYSMNISFNNATAIDSVFNNGHYIIKGIVKAAGPIKTVQFYRNFIVNNAQDSVELAATRLNPNKDTCNFNVRITGVTYQTRIRVIASRSDGSQTSSVYVVNKCVRDTLTAYSGIQLGGWTSNYHSGFDVDNGVGVSSNKTSGIDAFFDHGQFAATDLDALVYYQEDYPNGARFPDTGTRFAKTNFTSAQFDSFTDDASFMSMKGTLSVIDVQQGDVIFFQTTAGRKGLLRIASLGDPLGDIVVDEKIQQ